MLNFKDPTICRREFVFLGELTSTTIFIINSNFEFVFGTIGQPGDNKRIGCGCSDLVFCIMRWNLDVSLSTGNTLFPAKCQLVRVDIWGI